jgi:hypothetical protein
LPLKPLNWLETGNQGFQAFPEGYFLEKFLDFLENYHLHCHLRLIFQDKLRHSRNQDTREQLKENQKL